MSIDSTPSLKEIADIIGDSAPHSLSEFYRLNFTQGNAPTSGAISLSNFRNKTTLQTWSSQAQATVTGPFYGEVDFNEDATEFVGGEGSYNSQRGEIRHYTKSGNSWNLSNNITAPNAAPGDLFGWSSDISHDGNYLVAGAPWGSKSYIFVKSGNSWSNQIAIALAANYNGGRSTTINGDGTHAIIAQPGYYGVSGSVKYYNRSGNTWTNRGNISSPGGANNDSYGASVSISKDGNYCIIGAPYQRTTNTPAVYMYVRSGNSWSRQARITTALYSGYFGNSVSMSGDGTTAIVGRANPYGNGSGGGDRVLVYTRSGNSWSLQQTIASNDLQYTDYFAYDVSIDDTGNKIIAGAPNENSAGTDRGAIYIFSRSGNTWSQQVKATYTGSWPNGFGSHVAFARGGSHAIAVGFNNNARIYYGNYFM